MSRAPIRILPLILLMFAASACSVMPPDDFPRAKRVDLDRYMGTWYVIGHIPPDMTADAWNPVEHYERVGPARVRTTFTYREGAFDGERERLEMSGRVLPGTGNAVWAQRPFWPLRFENTISYVGPDYDTTIVARSARDYVWIMARTPRIDAATRDDLVRRVERLGYDTAELRWAPQQPLDARDDRP